MKTRNPIIYIRIAKPINPFFCTKWSLLDIFRLLFHLLLCWSDKDKLIGLAGWWYQKLFEAYNL